MSRIRNEMNATATPYEEPAPVSGFRENLEAGVGQMVDEELSISRLIHTYEPTQARNDKIREARDAGDISDDVWHKYSEDRKFEASPVDWEGLAISEGFDTIDDIQKRIDRETLTPRRKYRQDVFSRADTAGVAGQFVGMAAAGALDPIMYPTYLLGPVGVSKSLSVLNTAGKVAAREAVIGGASQAAVEPFIHAWKEDIGATYTVGDSIANIAMTAGASGVIGGAIGAATHQRATVSQLKKKVAELRTRKWPEHMTEPEQRQADATLRQQEEELADAPPDMDAEEYMADVEAEVSYQEKLKPQAPAPNGEPKVTINSMYADDSGKLQSLELAKKAHKEEIDELDEILRECFPNV